MKIVFFGTPEFAKTSLEALLNAGMDVCAVVTAPDKPAGRGKQLSASDVKKFAAEKGLKILQPANLKDEGFLGELRALNAGLFIVVAFRMLPEAVWKMPTKGTINLHASLLPRYRGAAPINHAIMNGEKITGVTTFFIREEIDTGNILFREEVPITEEDDAGTLHDKLMRAGSGLVIRTARAIENGSIQPVPQSELASGELPVAPKIFKETCRIRWTATAADLHRFVRGLSPYPAAWTEFHCGSNSILPVKIFQVRTSDHRLKPGEIFCEGGHILIGCGEGSLDILSLQAAGKKRMPAADFLRGFSFPDQSFAV
ncbi:MAG: methionyl-tRNA formyltransferase [Bacteroidia bacterium]|nr:methionyl-tRNA formyltransferase [Bacteroidia bacterium]